METIENVIRNVLWNDYDDEMEFPNQTPLLSHYTSIRNFESMMKSEEMWFANPLTMNDTEELLFGMRQGEVEFKNSKALFEACGNQETFFKLQNLFNYHHNNFGRNHAFDTYILCFSEHEKDDYDGALSMWRGYGANGQGIAFVLDSKKIESNENSPIIVAAVKYASAKERLLRIQNHLSQVASVLAKLDKSDEILNLIAFHWIEWLKVFSLFTKHRGFMEEKEWRCVYMRDRDKQSEFEPMFDYNTTEVSIDPKLKLKLHKLPGHKSKLEFNSIIDRIIIGPTSASGITHKALARMLSMLGKDSLVDKIHSSSIPYRP